MSHAHDDDDWAPTPLLGSASAGSGEPAGEADEEYPLAMLWLPNPEYASGWETRRVKRQAAPATHPAWRGLVR